MDQTKVAKYDFQRIKTSAGITPYKQLGLKLGLNKCLFHDDRSPSLSIYQRNGAYLYHCFGCGQKGDVVHFVKIVQGCSTKEALEILTTGNNFRLADVQTDLDKQQRERRLVDAYKKMEAECYNKLCALNRMANQIAEMITLENMDTHGLTSFFLAKDILEYELDILCNGSAEDKLSVFYGGTDG